MANIGHWYNPFTQQGFSGAKPSGKGWVVADPKTGKALLSKKTPKTQTVVPEDTSKKTTATQKSLPSTGGSLAGTMTGTLPAGFEGDARLAELEKQYQHRSMGAFKRAMQSVAEFAYDDRRKQEMTEEQMGFDPSAVSGDTFAGMLNYFNSRRGGEISQIHKTAMETYQESQNKIKEEIDELRKRKDTILEFAMKNNIPVSYEDLGMSGKIDGSRAWRNNNPGNIEYGGFAKSMGATGTDGRFAIFPDVATGRNAMISLLRAPNYANLTLDAGMKRWSGNGYGAEVAGGQFDANRTIGSLDDDELNFLADKMTEREGWVEGTIRSGEINTEEDAEENQEAEMEQQITQSVQAVKLKPQEYADIREDYAVKYGSDALIDFDRRVKKPAKVNKFLDESWFKKEYDRGELHKMAVKKGHGEWYRGGSGEIDTFLKELMTEIQKRASEGKSDDTILDELIAEGWVIT